MAERLYNSGHAFFQKGLYSEALIELQRAKDAFRQEDAGGHPFTSHLPNGVSGLANSIALSGRCHQQLGDFKAALICYETSLINSKFEKKRPWTAFTKSLTENFIFCAEKIFEESGGDRKTLLDREQEIDISFRFPYSLSPDVIPLARLYELAPKRYPQYKDFYQNAKKKDSQFRRLSKTADESSLRRTGSYVWGILAAIWVIYGLITLRALIQYK